MIRWLQQLRLVHKFIILGAISLVMMAVPTFLYLQSALFDLHKAQQGGLKSEVQQHRRKRTR